MDIFIKLTILLRVQTLTAISKLLDICELYLVQILLYNKHITLPCYMFIHGVDKKFVYWICFCRCGNTLGFYGGLASRGKPCESALLVRSLSSAYVFSCSSICECIFFYTVKTEQGVLTEQRTNIKFLVKLSKNGREILEMLETVYGESAMKHRTVYKWVDRCKEGRESVNHNAQEGHC
jgi:hypothetical protein